MLAHQNTIEKDNYQLEITTEAAITTLGSFPDKINVAENINNVA